jgi:hypothetical protein
MSDGKIKVITHEKTHVRSVGFLGLPGGGAINLISPEKTVSRNYPDMASSGYLVEVEPVLMAQMEEWIKQYPEAFEREYNPAAGLRFNARVEGGI